MGATDREVALGAPQNHDRLGYWLLGLRLFASVGWGSLVLVYYRRTRSDCVKEDRTVTCVYVFTFMDHRAYGRPTARVNLFTVGQR